MTEDVIVKLVVDPHFYSIPFEKFLGGPYRVEDAWDEMVDINVIPARPFLDAGYQLNTLTCESALYSLGGAHGKKFAEEHGHPFLHLRKDDVVVIPADIRIVSFRYDNPGSGRGASLNSIGLEKWYKEAGVIEENCMIRRLEDFELWSLNGELAREIYYNFKVLGMDGFMKKYFPGHGTA